MQEREQINENKKVNTPLILFRIRIRHFLDPNPSAEKKENFAKKVKNKNQIKFQCFQK